MQAEHWTNEDSVKFESPLYLCCFVFLQSGMKGLAQNFDLCSIFMLIHYVTHFHDKDCRKSRIRYRIFQSNFKTVMRTENGRGE